VPSKFFTRFHKPLGPGTPIAEVGGNPKTRSLVKVLGVSALLTLGAAPACYAAWLHRDLGRHTCFEQVLNCFGYSRLYRPPGAERRCVAVYRWCLKTGVWDGKDAFPYGGALITGMVRR
jgi:hypothetical protein